MITWSSEANMQKICVNLNDHISSFRMKDYFIYGLALLKRPHVRIAGPVPSELHSLFQRSGYILESSQDYIHPTQSKIEIGIRRDIRSRIDTSKKLIKTIIFAMERKLIILPEDKLFLGSTIRKEILS